MDGVRKVVLVLSGKGGVGKTTAAVCLSLALAQLGKVGLLDADLTGPSVPAALGVAGEVVRSSSGWAPVQAGSISALSLGFLLPNKDDAVIWRGPKKNAMIKQFLSDVDWGNLDFLVIDTPPGTSDEHIALAELLRDADCGAVIVTTPQDVSLADVRREISFCRTAQIRILGLVENMSGFVCPHCAECTDVFKSGGGEKLAQEQSIKFLGRIPIDPELSTLMETNKLVEDFDKIPLCDIYKKIARNLIE